MRVSLIVAASTNNVIGRAGSLPWHLPQDLRRFKSLTIGKPIVMGRATFESIGRALPERRNIVLTTNPDFSAEGCEIAADTEAAVELAGPAPELMVIGGARVYADFLPRAGRIYLTRVHATIDGDRYFPALDRVQWELAASEEFAAEPGRLHAFSFEVHERRAR